MAKSPPTLSSGNGQQLPAQIDESAFLSQSSEALAPGTGAGISTEAADNLIPLITVFQALSPQVSKEDPRYIEGAEAGSIWLRNHNLLIKGSTGFYWMRVAFERNWIEWIDRERGGGFVARYDDIGEIPDCTTAVRSSRNRFNFTNQSTGNEITMFHNHYGFVLGQSPTPLPYMISYKGAGITVSRSWNSQFPQIREDTKVKADAWDFIWQMTTQFKSNTKGKWYDLVPHRRLPGYTKPELVTMAKALATQFEKKEVQGDFREAPTEVSSAAGGAVADEIPF